jgi:hypothetical protein
VDVAGPVWRAISTDRVGEVIAPAIGNDAEALREPRYEVRPEPLILESAMDQHNRIAFTSVQVCELDAVDREALNFIGSADLGLR